MQPFCGANFGANLCKLWVFMNTLSLLFRNKKVPETAVITGHYGISGLFLSVRITGLEPAFKLSMGTVNMVFLFVLGQILGQIK